MATEQVHWIWVWRENEDVLADRMGTRGWAKAIGGTVDERRETWSTAEVDGNGQAPEAFGSEPPPCTHQLGPDPAGQGAGPSRRRCTSCGRQFTNPAG